MPFLRKKPFHKLHLSSDYRDDDEVFHCEVTNEVFKDYNEYCERIILCNSTIWSCSITGKTNMTYEEALNCEENAKASLKEFPMELRIPILYLTTRTNRSSFSEMLEDVFQYARDRYFIGEMVEASFNEDSWCDCHVLQVIEPTDDQIKAYLKENPKPNPQERNYHPPAKLFRYEVEQLDCGDSEASQIMIVEASQVRRKKQLFSRDRNKIFLRMLCEQSSNGTWVVKEEIQQKYGIPKVRFDSIFAGPIPDFSLLPKKPIVVKQKQSTLDKFVTYGKSPTPMKPTDAPKVPKSEDKNHMKKPKTSKMNGKLIKPTAEEKKAMKKEEQLQKREEKRELKLKQAAAMAYKREWYKPREDLECEDLKPLPEPTQVNSQIPDENFGDFVMILEFLRFFHEELEVSSYFPNGLTFEVLEKALLSKETSGSWSDFLQLLLANIFKHQAEEEDEIHESNANEIPPIDSMDHGVSSMAEAVKLATMASTWSQNHQGSQLSELTLDHVTVSEILRQHLLSSGGRISELASKWRYSQRGGYNNHDDPALSLRINYPRILRMLGHRSVCEFELKDKLTVATCLINQLLTFASIRDVIEERYEKLHQARRDLKSFIVAEQKKEKEERDKLREKEKERELAKENGVKVEESDEKPKKTRGSREEEKKREEYDQKLAELRTAAKDDQMMLLLGSDRAYRRYWRILAIPGIFVEDNELHPGTCLPEGTPHVPGLENEADVEIYLTMKFEDEISDNKENDSQKLKKMKKVSFSDKKEKNGLKSPRKEVDPRVPLIACTADKDCPVHMARSVQKWSFFGSQDEIEALITGLNVRGIRESELRNNLIQESESIAAALENCPKFKLNPNVYTQSNNNNNSSNSKSRKSKQENTNLNYPSDVAIDEVLDLTLRDSILDMEDKLKLGCLGSLKVKDREIWRKNVATPGAEIENLALNSAIEKIKNESRSRPGTPDSEVENPRTYRDPGKYLGPAGEDEMPLDEKQQKNIKQMAVAILQLFHAVEPKYLKRPLGNDDKDKKYNAEEVREKWEQSLMASKSWSQLFLHLNTLDNSVAWGRSALNARCRICRKCRDAENMLLCDGCNKGQHLYCLKPKLTSVPEGDWFCSNCKPKETKPKSKTRNRKKFEDEDEEDLTKEEEMEVDEEDQSEEDSEEEEEIVKPKPKPKPKKVELCGSCGSDGSLIVCDTCPKLYHLDCVEPPLSRAPRGRWSCHECKNLKKNPVKFDSSENGEAEQRQTRRATKRAAQVQDKSLHDLLNDVMHHRDSWPFLSPVRTDEVPDYYEFIKKPMDFGTIKTRLEAGTYENDSKQFFADCLLIFDNCHTYNKDHSTVYKAGMRLSKYFEKKSREMGFNYDEETHRPPPPKRFKEDTSEHSTNGDLRVNGAES